MEYVCIVNYAQNASSNVMLMRECVKADCYELRDRTRVSHVTIRFDSFRFV